MALSDSRTQIIVACISVIGVIGAAVVANHASSSFSTPSTTQASTAGTAPASTSAPQPSAQSQPATAQAQQTSQPASIAQPTLSSQPQPSTGEDSVNIVSVKPRVGTLLHAGQLTNFEIGVDYNLASLPNAMLTVALSQYDNSTSCSGPNRSPADQKSPITQGAHHANVVIPYIVGRGKNNADRGSLGLRAGIWDNHQRTRVFEFPGYCFPFE